MTYRIYVLRDPRIEGIEAVRYVGATQMYLSGRLKFHLMDVNRDDETSPRGEWLRRLHEENVRPDIEEVEKLGDNPREAASRENFWIDHYEAQGCKLLNVRRGGGGLSYNNKGSPSPSAWAICRLENIPDKAIAKHEGVHVSAVASWRRERSLMSYREHKDLFSSICSEVAMVASTWDDIVEERMQLETQEIPGCSVYQGWIDRLEESVKLTRDVKLLRDEGLEGSVAAYCRSLIRTLKSDMLLTGHDALMKLFRLWDEIQEQRRVCEDSITMDDLDVWVGQLVTSKRSVNPDNYEYELVIDMYGRYIARLREERKNYRCLFHTLRDYPSPT